MARTHSTSEEREGGRDTFHDPFHSYFNLFEMEEEEEVKGLNEP
jgi:hypothetical protein